MILNGDSLDVLKTLESDTIDTIITDPPYGYSFMGKDWDKAVPSVEIWQECLRVLKPGAFMCVMSAPRSDVQCAMISRLQEAGFRLDFTPIYWTYASGFPKAGNIGKLVDKRLGVEPNTEHYEHPQRQGRSYSKVGGFEEGRERGDSSAYMRAVATSPEAKALDGSYTGFQPKPAVEVIIVAMKPLSEKTYIDQALSNGKGISWLDDGRIPTSESFSCGRGAFGQNGVYGKAEGTDIIQHESGRFPANLLVSDDVLNDGTFQRDTGHFPKEIKAADLFRSNQVQDEKFLTGGGGYSRYFDLDKWGQTLPFLVVPKASKREKNKGLDRNNGHPTVKPLRLMSYLITLFSRPGDVVLDPFVGSGTTVVAAKQLGRNGIGIEREAEYAEIAQARYNAAEVTETEQDKQLELV